MKNLLIERFDLNQPELILFPVHVSDQWYLSCIDASKKEVQILNSRTKPDNNYYNIKIAEFLEDRIDIFKWPIMVDTSLPQQSRSLSGIYMKRERNSPIVGWIRPFRDNGNWEVGVSRLRFGAAGNARVQSYISRLINAGMSVFL